MKYTTSNRERERERERERNEQKKEGTLINNVKEKKNSSKAKNQKIRQNKGRCTHKVRINRRGEKFILQASRLEMESSQLQEIKEFA